MRTAFFLLGLLAVPAFADDAADKADGSKQLAEAVGRFNEQCSASLAVSYDWASEAAAPGKPAYQGPIYCKSIVEGLTSGCADPDAKAIAAAQLKTLACRYEAGVSKKKELDPYGGPLLVWSGTSLTASYDWASSNLEVEAGKWAARAR